MNSEDGQVYSNYTTVCSQNINKQIVNIADENLTNDSFLSIEFVTEFPCLLGHPVELVFFIKIKEFTKCRNFPGQV